MFSWICPKCGHDVPPSKTDCPYCAENAQQAVAAGQATEAYPVAAPPPQRKPPAAPSSGGRPPAWQPPPSPPAWQPPPPPPVQSAPAWPPPPSGYAAQYSPQTGAQVAPSPVPPPPGGWQAPPRRPSPPTWLLGVGFALGFLVLLGGVYYGLQRSGPARAGVEDPTNPSHQKVSNPLQKVVEVTGVRLLEENKKPVARFIVVNHSKADISDLAANVNVVASTSRSEEDPVGTFSFRIPNLAPGQSAEITEPLKTKLKAYELPDWQNATTDVQITSPAASQP